MLIIITHDKDGKQIDHEEWSLGDPVSCRVRGLHCSYLHVIAHGSELEWIRANISGIRMHRGDQVRWIGEDAVFITNALSRAEEGST